jgi:hypothetical protein
MLNRSMTWDSLRTVPFSLAYKPEESPINKNFIVGAGWLSPNRNRYSSWFIVGTFSTCFLRSGVLGVFSFFSCILLKYEYIEVQRPVEAAGPTTSNKDYKHGSGIMGRSSSNKSSKKLFRLLAINAIAYYSPNLPLLRTKSIAIEKVNHSLLLLLSFLWDIITFKQQTDVRSPVRPVLLIVVNSKSSSDK